MVTLARAIPKRNSASTVQQPQDDADPPDALPLAALTVGQYRTLHLRLTALSLDAQKPPSDVTDTAGACEELKVSAPTIVRQCEEEGLPHFFVGSHRRFSRAAIREWRENRTIRKARQ
jgi:excisionase family DNA binding protein